ncbi:hypothetical protein T492DRAFT_914381 [Pavlovales sp. CCMP2436]|nr:hypothetical protein T492DRAFT_914381 [Pavlovales sp. CCMP2436]
MYALMGVSPMEAAARIKKQLIDTIVAIGAAHGLAVLIVAVVHGLALVVERVAKEVEFARLLMLRAVEAEAGRALQHGVGARRAHDREEGDTRTSRIAAEATTTETKCGFGREPLPSSRSMSYLEVTLVLLAVACVQKVCAAVTSNERTAKKLGDEWRRLDAHRIQRLGPMHAVALGSLHELADRTATFLGTFTQRNYARKVVNFAKDRDTFAALADELQQLMRALYLGIAVDVAPLQLAVAAAAADPTGARALEALAAAEGRPVQELLTEDDLTFHDLDFHKLGPTVLRDGLLHLLAVNASLTGLGLDSNQIGDMCALGLGKALEVNDALTSSALPRPSAPDSPIWLPQSVSVVSDPLTELNLSFNNFGDASKSQWQPINITSLNDGALLPVVVEIDPALVCGGEQEPVFVPMAGH